MCVCIRVHDACNTTRVKLLQRPDMHTQHWPGRHRFATLPKTTRTRRATCMFLSCRVSALQVAAELAALHTDLFPAQRGSREVLMAMTSSLAPVSAVDLLLTPKTTDYPSSAQDTTKSPIATQHASQAAETKPTAALSPRGADAAEDKATVTMGCRCCIM